MPIKIRDKKMWIFFSIFFMLIIYALATIVIDSNKEIQENNNIGKQECHLNEMEFIARNCYSIRGESSAKVTFFNLECITVCKVNNTIIKILYNGQVY